MVSNSVEYFDCTVDTADGLIATDQYMSNERSASRLNQRRIQVNPGLRVFLPSLRSFSPDLNVSRQMAQVGSSSSRVTFSR